MSDLVRDYKIIKRLSEGGPVRRSLSLKKINSNYRKTSLKNFPELDK